jgi:hypothetical protein
MRAAVDWVVALVLCMGYGAWSAAQNLGAFQ